MQETQESEVEKIPWSRKWQPTPVFLPGKSHGQRSLVGYSPQGHKESDMTKRTHMRAHTHTHTHNAHLPFPKSEVPLGWRSVYSLLSSINGTTKCGWQHICLQHGFLNILSPLLRPTARKKTFLLIDNTPGHPSALMEMYNEINVVFMPANTTAILKPWIKK